MELEVYLVDSNFSMYCEPSSAYDNNGLVLTNFALHSKGIKSQLFPKTAVICNCDDKASFHKDVLLEELLGAVDDRKQNVFGLSAFTASSDFLEGIAKVIKKEYPDAILIGGGPDFTASSETKTKVYNGPLDAYVVGHSGPLIDICSGMMNGEIKFENRQFLGNMPNGSYYRSKGNMAGKGYGRFPEIDVDCVDNSILKLKKTDVKEYVRFYAVLSDRCPNNCGYCSSPKSGRPAEFFMNYVHKMADNPFFKDKTVIIDIEDNNPLIMENRALTEEFLSASARASDNMWYSNFLDPSLLVDDYDYILNTVLKSKSRRGFFIGMDYRQEKSAKKYGRNWYGIARDQKRLDAELEGVVRFVKEVDAYKKHTDNGIHSEDDGITRVSLSYIISPDDDLSAYRQLACEMLYLSALNPTLDNYRIQPHSGILTPFPGTKIRRENREHINDKMPWSSYNTWTNIWNDAPLLDRLETAFHIPLAEKKTIIEMNANTIAQIVFPYVSSKKDDKTSDEKMLEKLSKWALRTTFDLSDKLVKDVGDVERAVSSELESIRIS